MTPSVETYSLGARILHWLTAIIVLAAIPAGYLMDHLDEGPLADTLYDLHRSLGATLILVVILSLVWRLAHAPPPLPADMGPIEKFAARGVHWALYVLVLAQPIVGWIASSAYPSPVRVFWLFDLPSIWPEDRAFSERLFHAHHLIGYAIAVLVCIHIAAALFHRFVRRDAILRRMWA